MGENTPTPAAQAESAAPAGFEAGLLARLAGERRAVGAHNPFLASDPGRAWLILRGRLDILLVPTRAGEVVGVGTHLLTLGHGEVLFGMPPVPLDPADPDGLQLSLRAVAAIDGELFEAAREGLEQGDLDLILVDWIDRWVERLTERLAAERPMPAHVQLEADPGQRLDPSRAATAPHGSVVWLRLEAGVARLFGQAAAEVAAGGPAVPVTDRSWLAVVGTAEARVSGFLTPTILLAGFAWASLDAFHRLALPLLRHELREQAMAWAARARRRERRDARAFGDALGRVAAVLGIGRRKMPQPEADEPLLAAAQMVAHGAGAMLQLAPDGGEVEERLAASIRRSGLRMRTVALKDGWWARDPGPLLAWLAGTEGAAPRPVALLPSGPGRMVLVDPQAASPGGPPVPVEAAVAARLLPEARLFYAPLPFRQLSLRDVLGLAGRNAGPDIKRLAVLGAMGGLIAVLTPLATSYLFSKVLPRGDSGTFAAVITGLFLAAFGAAVFEIVRGVAVLRLQSRADATVQPAIWDRVLRMPAGFFRDYTVGDLVDRANSFGAMRELLTTRVTHALLGAIFSLFSLVVLLVFSWRLTLVALAVTAVLILVVALIARLQLPAQRALLAATGRSEGLFLQLLVGLTKLRNAGAEERGFARWTDAFAEQQHHRHRVQGFRTVLEVVSSAYTPAAALIVYLVGARLGLPGTDGAAPTLDAAAFAGFNAAFGQFSRAMLQVAAATGDLAGIGPLYQRMGPLLNHVPEGAGGATDPGELTGAIEVRHLTFRYETDGPPVLDDLSLDIRPGEFVALVGASGSGKSTVVRLLLGFERAERGSIAFDGQDTGTLDLPAMRRQIGVVLQSGQLTPGTLYENIMGGALISLEDAWTAARLAGLEADIRAMPMGMQTVVTEGGTALSGGQRQRVLIARALARQPRILIFDEATSALDNRTQALVNESLERLNVTRIVVAHRLTTVMGAHRILVFERGRVVESGTFKDLMARGGIFAGLARRQML